MDSDRFDAFARAISATGSRRATLAGLLGGTVGLLGLTEADASRQDKKARRRQRRRTKRQRRRERNGDQPPGDPGPSTCSGTDSCGQRCGPDNNCFCWIADDTGEPFCGGSSFDVLNCSQCPLPQICVNLTDCGVNGGFACAPACGEAD